MPKRAKALTDTAVRKLKPGTHAVGGVAGLLLVVHESQAKDADGELVRSWVLRYTTGETRISKKGKPFAVRRDFGLGAYPEVPLKDARDRAREARDLIRQGIDPVTHKRELLEAMRAAQATRMSFAEAARRCHAVRAQEFKNGKHSTQWLGTLKTYAFPKIGNRQVADIDVHDVVKVLEPIWTTKTETATRVRQRIEAVLSWATVAKHREGDNPARWQSNLDQLLPKASKARKSSHWPALPYTRVGQFMAELSGREGMGARALQFAILTAARSGEVRLMEWDEIDFDAKLWTVPPERMKSGKAHRVPLSADAVALLKALPRLDATLVFPGAKSGKPLSDNTLRLVIRRMHGDDVKAGGEGWTDPTNGRTVVAHGFRSSYKDWSRNVATKYSDEVGELALAHVNDDKTRAAYARDELLPRRKPMMAEWAKYCGQPIEPGTVAKLERSA